MKKLFLKFFLTLFLFFFLNPFFPTALAVLTPNDLFITPGSVNFGSPVSIVVTNIPPPNQGQDMYEVQVFKSNLLRTGQGLKAGARILVNYRNNRATCADQRTTGPWVTSECVGSTTGLFTFAASLDTGKLEVDPGSQYTEHTVVISLSSSETPGRIAQQPTLEKTFFVVQAVQSNATFSIDSTTPSKPAPGDKIKIELSGITKFGIYTPGTRTPDVNQRAECNSSTCTLFLTLPPIMTTPGIAIVVQDPEGNIKQATLSIDTSKPFPTAALTVAPPPPPCVEWTPSKDKCLAVDTAIGKINTDLVNFVKSIFGIILSLSGGIALLLIILSGYKLMFSQGNPEKAQEAKETLTAAIVGLLFIIFSLIILQVIGVDILRIPGFVK